MKFISFILSFVVLHLRIFAGFADAFIFYVAPNGSDSNPGTQQAPFLTLQRARDAVRALPSAAFKHQDVYVLLRGGTYRMQQPLALTPQDSGRSDHDVVYAAYPGETPVLSGAIQVTNWSLHDAGLGIYVSHITPVNSRQLYVNGNMAQRAQTTAYPSGFRPSLASGGIEFIVTNLNPPAWQDPTTWTNQPYIEAVILTQWRMMRVPIQSISPGLITMQQPGWTNANVNFDVTTNQPGIWSFWQVTRFENAYQFLLEPGQWYLDPVGGFVYYIPRAGENINTADVELPLLETLVQGQGALGDPIHNIRFEGLTFSYATWLGPSSGNGYVADQSGMLLLGSGHQPNYIGHDPNVVPTPGNIQFIYAQNIVFRGNIFQNLGGVALQFWSGSQNNTIDSNLFQTISSAAIELGGVSAIDHHPSFEGQITKDNLITNNLIKNVGTEYQDAAGIFVGFSSRTTISNNTIINTPWSGIAMGWGWGLLDKGGYLGLPHAVPGQWGTFTTMTPNKECQIINNRIEQFINILWDGGAIYTTGRQGPSKSQGLLIKGNVACNKRTSGGSNTIYTDGGSRCVRVESNVSFNNPIGITFFGPLPQLTDPLPYPPYALGNNIPYGSDFGGCRTYGDIHYADNYWLEMYLSSNFAYNNFINKTILGTPPYGFEGFFNICPYNNAGISYPTELSYKNNHPGFSLGSVPTSLLQNAGVQQRPSTIPAALWNAD